MRRGYVRAGRDLGLIAALVVASFGCTSVQQSPPTAQTSPSASASACAPTVPTSTPPPELDATGAATYYGNQALWVDLWPGGIVDVTTDQVGADGSLGVKFPWWRLSTGSLEITAVRLDGPTGKVVVKIPSGYGQTGFQSNGVYFPTPGCWQVTGQVGSSSLTFVTLIRLAPASSRASDWPAAAHVTFTNAD